MTFALGMMQTAANEGEAREEETKGTGGPCVCVCGCVCLWNIRSGYLSQTDRSEQPFSLLVVLPFVISYIEI